jgi:hypothetical protein
MLQSHYNLITISLQSADKHHASIAIAMTFRHQPELGPHSSDHTSAAGHTSTTQIKPVQLNTCSRSSDRAWRAAQQKHAQLSTWSRRSDTACAAPNEARTAQIMNAYRKSSLDNSGHAHAHACTLNFLSYWEKQGNTVSHSAYQRATVKLGQPQINLKRSRVF